MRQTHYFSSTQRVQSNSTSTIFTSSSQSCDTSSSGQLTSSRNFLLPYPNPSDHSSLVNWRTSSQSFDTSSSDQLNISRNFLLPYPNLSDHNSSLVNSRNNNVIDTEGPQLHSQSRFLKRSEKTCPSNITKEKRTKWLKTGERARKNQALLSNYDSFHWPITHYDPPIHIHHQTPSNVINNLIQKMNHIHLFTIDTELDRPTKLQPKPVPALIQLQAIHNEQFATVVLIEVQHLPHRSTDLFLRIQKLCHIIFSPNNKIMSWGDVILELTPFTMFGLFDISQITNHLNIQSKFTDDWNNTHPHTPECLDRRQPNLDDESEGVLICLVNSDDLENDLHSMNYNSEVSSQVSMCICPDSIRPYKDSNDKWSLQKAIQFTFHKALDKSLTLNIWSCGLDLILRTWYTNRDKIVRESLTLYAINDLFAPTQIYFHFNRTDMNQHIPIELSHLNSIMSKESADLPSFYILSDSHCKNFQLETITSHYQLKIHAVSGLQWDNPHNRRLCAGSLLASPSISSTLTKSTALILLIGTNSVRNLPALQIIETVENIINMIRTDHVHLINKQDVTVALTFPCNKTSFYYPTIEQLRHNIDSYNHHLKLLAERKHFSTVDLGITEQHLHTDLMHIQNQYQDDLWEKIILYCDTLVIEKVKIPQSQHRSRAAITRRNKKRHAKILDQQKQHTLTRSIHPSWTVLKVKQFLKEHQIKFDRLPEFYNNKLRIQFTHEKDLHCAEELLSPLVFQEQCHFA